MDAQPRTTYLLIDGENLDATLGGSILGRRPQPEERPRWNRVLDPSRRRWGQPVRGLFFLAVAGDLPAPFVQAVMAIGYRPIPLQGDGKVVDIAIQRTLDGDPRPRRRRRPRQPRRRLPAAADRTGRRAPADRADRLPGVRQRRVPGGARPRDDGPRARRGRLQHPAAAGPRDPDRRVRPARVPLSHGRPSSSRRPGWRAGSPTSRTRHGGVELAVGDGRLRGAPPTGRRSPPRCPSTGRTSGDADPAAFAAAAVAAAGRGACCWCARAASRSPGWPASRLVEHKVGQRHVQGRTKAGGQSQQRFARRRDNQAREAYEAAADHAVRVLRPFRPGPVVTGGDRPAVDEVLADPRLRGLTVVEPWLAVPDPRRAGPRPGDPRRPADPGRGRPTPDPSLGR